MRRLTCLLILTSFLFSILRTNSVVSDHESSLQLCVSCFTHQFPFFQFSLFCVYCEATANSRELQQPFPSSVLSVAQHLQHQRTRWSHSMSLWHYQSLVLLLCLNGFLVLRENSYQAMRLPEKQALPGTSLTSIYLGFLSVAPIIVKSVTATLREPSSKNSANQRSECLTCRSMGWGDDGRYWSHCDVGPFATQGKTALYPSSKFPSQGAHFGRCQFNCKISSLSKYLIVHTNF